MEALSQYLHVSIPTLEKIISTLVILVLLTLGKMLINFVLRRRVTDVVRAYRYHRFVTYTYSVMLMLAVSVIWIEGFSHLSTFLGLASAGLAIAMHDTIANVTGWLFILARKPFKVGDRIEIDGITGDVIDLRIFQFSVVEVGNWVDAEQSTGRIIHIPNSKALREPVANYQIGFDYIWNEVPILITFESDWKRARELLNEIAHSSAEHLSVGAQEQIRNAARKYLIFYGALTPTVYTTVKDSGVMLTIRYLVNPRQRRISEQRIWEAVLDAFAAEPQIDLAYPTTRFYQWNNPSGQ